MEKDTGFVVLVVDDDELFRSVIVDVLNLKGYTVAHVANPLDALVLLRSPQRIDLLVTDVRMPGSLNGGQVVAMARATRPGLKVLYVTGYAMDLGEGWMEEPETQLMEKPFRLHALVGKVSSMLLTAAS